jgi:hypothetical protein
MLVITKKASLGRALTGLLVSLFALGAGGCSSTSDAPSGSDASADVQADVVVDAGPPPPLGVPVPSCAGCPVCDGILGSPTTGIFFCTKDCTAADCPTGTACVANPSSTLLDKECLATCTSDGDCVAPFICRSDVPGSSGSYCWTPYPPPVEAGAPDAGPADSGPSDTGAPVADTGAPDSAVTDAAVTDAAPADASDAAAE